MRERFQQWLPKIKSNKGRVMGAIATPVLLWIVLWLWVLPERSLQSDHDRLSQNESTTLTHQRRTNLISGLGAIATVTGGFFLFLNFRSANSNAEIASLNVAGLSDADFSDADLSGTDLSGADFINANLSGANLSGANLRYANLSGADLSGANLNCAELRYADLSGANLRYANLTRADLRYANLSGADLNCTLLSDANLSDANLSGALLFFINLREVLNLEPLQLEAQPSPFLCNVALPSYSQQPDVNPNRSCDRIPYLLSDRYDISLEEAQGIVDEARQHRWD
ncbi:MAG: pentapeptide repeat-containing protein [Cyanobacteria bacterium J06638_20]